MSMRVMVSDSPVASTHRYRLPVNDLVRLNCDLVTVRIGEMIDNRFIVTRRGPHLA